MGAPRTQFQVTVEREDAPPVVVTVKRPSEQEAADYYQAREDAQDSRRAAHGGHNDAADDILIGCVVGFAPAGEEAASAPADAFRELCEDYPHVPRQLDERFKSLCGADLRLVDVPRERIPPEVVGRANGKRLRAVLLDPVPKLNDKGKVERGPDGKPAFSEGRLVVLSRLSRPEVQFMEMEYATDGRKDPTVAQLVRAAKAHAVEMPDGVLAEYPLLAVFLGQLLYATAAAKIGDSQGKASAATA